MTRRKPHEWGCFFTPARSHSLNIFSSFAHNIVIILQHSSAMMGCEGADCA